jgi:mannose-binding lectin 2
MAMAMAMVVVVVLLLPSALLLLAGLPISRAELIERHSFTSPFSSHDHKGSRVIPHWETGGSAQVKQSFLRLTQDKPNQKGYVFSRGALGAQELSLAIKFRLSGMGADNFGDGLAVVIADKGKFESGNLLGFTDHFKGISVIFDTNRKDKNIDSIHRDVVLLASDGSKPMSQGGMTLTGCSANLRYSESRDDFNVLKSSRMRLKVTPQNVVTVEIDGRNTGRWRRCASIDLNEAGLETGWLESMRIGLTASTSSGSSDNHDVLHLRVYSAAEEATLLETEDLGSETVSSLPKPS